MPQVRTGQLRSGWVFFPYGKNHALGKVMLSILLYISWRIWTVMIQRTRERDSSVLPSGLEESGTACHMLLLLLVHFNSFFFPQPPKGSEKASPVVFSHRRLNTKSLKPSDLPFHSAIQGHI